LAQEAPASAQEGEVWVHLDAREGATLLQEQHGGPWTTVCTAPCDRPVRVDSRYRVMAGGMNPSGEFTMIAPPGGRETLAVHGGDRALVVTGKVTAAVGGVVAGVDLLVFLVGSAFAGGSDGGGGSSDSFNEACLAVLGLGALAIAGGVVLANANQQANVDQVALPSVAPPAAESSPVRPIWNTPAIDPRLLPPIVGASVLTLRF
jgi:hypothetical protein